MSEDHQARGATTSDVSPTNPLSSCTLTPLLHPVRTLKCLFAEATPSALSTSLTWRLAYAYQPAQALQQHDSTVALSEYSCAAPTLDWL